VDIGEPEKRHAKEKTFLGGSSDKTV